MATAEGLIIGAGALSFAGNFQKSGGIPPNSVAIVGSTIGLAFLASIAKGTALDGPVKAAAGLMLLVAVYVYVPAFTKDRKKGKRNG